MKFNTIEEPAFKLNPLNTIDEYDEMKIEELAMYARQQQENLRRYSPRAQIILKDLLRNCMTFLGDSDEMTNEEMVKWKTSISRKEHALFTEDRLQAFTEKETPYVNELFCKLVEREIVAEYGEELAALVDMKQVILRADATPCSFILNRRVEKLIKDLDVERLSWTWSRWERSVGPQIVQAENIKFHLAFNEMATRQRENADTLINIMKLFHRRSARPVSGLKDLLGEKQYDEIKLHLWGNQFRIPRFVTNDNVREYLALITTRLISRWFDTSANLRNPNLWETRRLRMREDYALLTAPTNAAQAAPEIIST